MRNVAWAFIFITLDLVLGQEFRNDHNQRSNEEQYRTPIPIISQLKKLGPDGSYKSSYETANHIQAEETGFVKNLGIKDEEAQVQHGSYTYTAPDGSVITVTYTADENGFRAEGAHLPTPPPVPEAIRKSLEIILAQQQNAQEEQQFAGHDNNGQRTFT